MVICEVSKFDFGPNYVNERVGPKYQKCYSLVFEDHLHTHAPCFKYIIGMKIAYKTLKKLKTSNRAIFSQFLRTDNPKFVSEKFFKGFQYAIWMQNMFQPIGAINRTDSRLIWTRICNDID